MANTGIAPQKPRPDTEDLPLEEQIRQRAHEIWLTHGGSSGTELDDWLQAENEIRQLQEV